MVYVFVYVYVDVAILDGAAEVMEDDSELPLTGETEEVTGLEGTAEEEAPGATEPEA